MCAPPCFTEVLLLGHNCFYRISTRKRPCRHEAPGLSATRKLCTPGISMSALSPCHSSSKRSALKYCFESDLAVRIGKHKPTFRYQSAWAEIVVCCTFRELS